VVCHVGGGSSARSCISGGSPLRKVRWVTALNRVTDSGAELRLAFDDLSVEMQGGGTVQVVVRVSPSADDSPLISTLQGAREKVRDIVRQAHDTFFGP
jgi:hypothetical protein